MKTSKAINHVMLMFTSVASVLVFHVTPVTAASVKPRVIATTDGEVDDRSTMVRFLVYSCDFDVAGIVQVNSRYQKSGHSAEKWIEAQLDAYEKVLPNLRKHNPDYPDAAKLRGIVRVGNENSKDLTVAPPDMETKNTPGAQLIIDTLLDGDPRPVHVLSWGGANTTASALWKLKTEYPKEKFDYAVSRIRIYCIWYQDGGGKWIQENIPQAYINEAYRWDNVWDYESIADNPRKKTGCANPPEVQEYMGYKWLAENVTTGHGPLGALYPQKYVSEGDTPSFLHLINNGLESHLDYTLGGWGGRSAYDQPEVYPHHLKDRSPDISDDGNVNKMYWRWIPAAQNDFAARMDWCVKDFKGANHAPVAQVKGTLRREVKPGEVVKLAATGTDPDGDKLTCKWWQYADADSATATVAIANSDSLDQASFVVPTELGKQIHIILEVTDDGTPPLVGYQRVICNIGGVTVSSSIAIAKATSTPTAVDIASLEVAVGLSDEQKSKVATLLTELKAKRRAIKEDVGLSSEEKKTQTTALNHEILGKGGRINAVMTDEQFARWDKLQQAIRAAR